MVFCALKYSLQALNTPAHGIKSGYHLEEFNKSIRNSLLLDEKWVSILFLLFYFIWQTVKELGNNITPG